MILNGSPRAPKSNSKRYAEIFMKYVEDSQYFTIQKKNYSDICAKMGECTDILFVFPLYTDALPVGLLDFLKYMEANPPLKKPVISVLINCGFFEYLQNEIAIRVMQLFCKQNNYSFGSVLMIGSGEAILDSPFKFLAKRKIKELADSIVDCKYQMLHVSMPLTKKMFQIASTYYWVAYGKKFGVTKQQMQTLKIEGK